MDETQFSYTPPATRYHSLNKMETEPAVIKALKAHCKKHKQYPVSIDEAVYDFISEGGRTKTVYSVHIKTASGNGDITMAAWVKANRFPWVFGMPTEIAREC